MIQSTISIPFSRARLCVYLILSLWYFTSSIANAEPVAEIRKAQQKIDAARANDPGKPIRPKKIAPQKKNILKGATELKTPVQPENDGLKTGPKSNDITGTLKKNIHPNEPLKPNAGKTTLQKKLPPPPVNHGGIALQARLVSDGPVIKSGLIWRVFEANPNKLGRHKLLSSHRSAEPVMSLPTGEYLINVALGQAYLTRRINVKGGENKNEDFVINAGGLRLSDVLANGNPAPVNSVRFDIYTAERDQYGKRFKIMEKIRPEIIVRLNAGLYHIVSTYGDANAKSKADVSVEAGKLTEITVNHHAAKITLKLVYRPGGEALANTQWSVLTPRGDVVKNSAGALPTHILAAGNYTILARRGGKRYVKKFSISAGETRQIEVIIQ